LGLKKAGREGRKPSLQPKQQEKIIAGLISNNKLMRYVSIIIIILSIFTGIIPILDSTLGIKNN
jgi:hypothetical protein